MNLTSVPSPMKRFFKAFSDLNECHDRLNQNSTNSSSPPSAEKPWTKIGLKQDALNNNSVEDPENQLIDLDKEKDIEEKTAQELNKQQPAQGTQESNSKTTHPKDLPDISPAPKNKPGKQKGAQGCGRTQKLPITNEIIHRAECCEACGASLDNNERFEAKTGHYVIDIVSNVNGLPGIQLTNTKHIYGDTYCHCSHVTCIFTKELRLKFRTQLRSWQKTSLDNLLSTNATFIFDRSGSRNSL
jgi:hypothetical protein